MNYTPIEHSVSLRIGSVEFVSPDEIKISLDLEAPDGIAANAGVPRAFPRINSYVLITTESGYIVGQVEWIAVEKSPFPKRKGFQDYGLVDLPFSLRKMRINPIGVLKGSCQEGFKFERGVQSFPSIGEPALIPTDAQLRAIVESGAKRRIKIGTSPIAANAAVMVDPDRLFGRHLAVLGNTGSGKSCSVAGLIQWSLTEAQKNKTPPNARFMIIDPNGEYSRVFCSEKSKHKARLFKVNCFRSHEPPYGLNDSLSTLRAIRSMFVPLSGHSEIAPGSSHHGCASFGRTVDTSSSHAAESSRPAFRLTSVPVGWLTLTGYGLPANVLVDRSLYKRRQACLAYQRVAPCWSCRL